MGNDVSFRDYESPKNMLRMKKIGFVKCCLRLRLKRAFGILKKTADFKHFQKQLRIANSKDLPADIYVFGSDTLWNFEDEFFKENAPFFTGADIQKPCYAYSMSIGSTTAEKLCASDVALQGIQKFKRIAVRDQHAEDVLSVIYPHENMVKTVDPTMLWDKETYTEHFSTKLPYRQKSLVVYYFGQIPELLWKAIKEFAHKKDLKIVNVGLHEKQYDFSVVPSPSNFISAFANADYIFTNTFHGCVFSTIFNKQFATNGVHKKKIEGYLGEFSLSDRVVSNPEDIEKVLTTPVDYDLVNAKIKMARAASVEYLNRVIEENHG